MPQESIKETVIRLANAALRKPVDCFFDNANYATPEDCKKAAMVLRNNFNAMKARDRREALKDRVPNNSPFAEMGCFLYKTPTGWRVTFGGEWEGFKGMRVEHSNGEPVTLWED